MTDNMQRREIEERYGKLSPFELKDRLISYAEEGSRKSTKIMLNAGRGNPNWIASTPRDAFFTLGHYAVTEAKLTWEDGDLAGMAKKPGIYNRFMAYADAHPGYPGMDFLRQAVEFGIVTQNFDPDAWVHELVDGIIGDNYPVPDRMLRHMEEVVNDYIIQEVYGDRDIGKFHLFAVEGATAAMCYLFDTLVANSLLHPGDRIAIMVPIFTPYLEVPHLPRYHFDTVEIHASELREDGSHTWQYPSSELDKLKDPTIKALFIVNPSNPPSVAIRPETVHELKRIVSNHNPELMIISDDVYCTFVQEFRSLMTELPYNTVGVYSFSKYFGVTGWRLGVVAVHEHNVFDDRLKNLPRVEIDRLAVRYGALTEHPEEVRFIDRMVADSRAVALNHTAGLSTPQQVQMALFSIFALLDREDVYKKQTMEICRRRQRLLFEGLGVELREDPYDAAYYFELDLMEWAQRKYGQSFANFLMTNYSSLDLLFRLAEEHSIVLLNGGGFRGPEWSVRFSLANLDDEAYLHIGQMVRQTFESYVAAWKASEHS
ncbi:aspartate 4-decarboxylase [Paenibacillus guangzhouensis]|uniref:aspartate 4-decarboxylase n=1 Tax=Paenibacillus guangzhouensis TaxID=1473112 RepID=UPI001266FD45|nr:aspartate 4-decarboxylase [Paenibacillus guangzhouensis]